MVVPALPRVRIPGLPTPRRVGLRSLLGKKPRPIRSAEQLAAQARKMPEVLDDQGVDILGSLLRPGQWTKGAITGVTKVIGGAPLSAIPSEIKRAHREKISMSDFIRENTGVELPTAARVAVDILDPLDPATWLAFGSVSKLGRAAKAADLAMIGKAVDVGGQSIEQLARATKFIGRPLAEQATKGQRALIAVRALGKELPLVRGVRVFRFIDKMAAKVKPVSGLFRVGGYAGGLQGDIIRVAQARARAAAKGLGSTLQDQAGVLADKLNKLGLKGEKEMGWVYDVQEAVNPSKRIQQLRIPEQKKMAVMRGAVLWRRHIRKLNLLEKAAGRDIPQLGSELRETLTGKKAELAERERIYETRIGRQVERLERLGREIGGREEKASARVEKNINRPLVKAEAKERQITEAAMEAGKIPATEKVPTAFAKTEAVRAIVKPIKEAVAKVAAKRPSETIAQKVGRLKKIQNKFSGTARAKALTDEIKILEQEVELIPNYARHMLSEEAQEIMRALGRSTGYGGREFDERLASDLARKFVNEHGRPLTAAEVNTIVRRKGTAALIGVPLKQMQIKNILGPMASRKYSGQVAKFFETDPRIIAMVESQRVAKAVTGQEYLENMAGIFGKPVEVVIGKGGQTAYKTLPGYAQIPGEMFKEWQFPAQLIPDITNSIRAYFTSEELNKAVQLFNDVQGWWKGQATVIWPSFQMRNFMSNMWSNYLAGITNLRDYIDAGRIQLLARGVEKGALSKLGVRIIRLGGKRYTMSEILHEALKRGVIDTDFFSLDVATARGARESLEGPTLFATLTGKPLIEAGGKVSSAVENNSKLSHFIGRLRKGDNLEEAAMSVKKFLFDYGDVTPFEAKIMRSIFPFYTWTRKNIPLQLEQLLTQPGKQVKIARLAGATEAEAEEPVPRELLPPWLARRMPIRVGSGKEGRPRFLALEGTVPLADVGKLGRPLWAAGEMLSPILKVPLEQAINLEFGTRMPVEKFPGERGEFLGISLPKRAQPFRLFKDPLAATLSISLLRNVRLLSELDRQNPFGIFGGKDTPGLFGQRRVSRTDMDTVEKVLTFLGFSRFQPVDIEKAKTNLQYKIDRNLGTLKSALKRVEKLGDEVDAVRLRKLIAEVENAQPSF